MFRHSSSLLALMCLSLSGCSGGESGGSPASDVGGNTNQATQTGGSLTSGATGGSSALASTRTGGSGSIVTSAVGGAAESGGAKTGGAPATGGTLATGGTKTGGAPATGGTVNAGGARTGGAPATGGSRTGGAPATGGMPATGGARTGGAAATGGARTGGAAATGGSATSGSVSCSTGLPAYTSSTTVSSTITISGTKDYGMQRFCADPSALGPGDQSESQKPIFMLAKGAVLKNVIIGGSGCSAADGVHCESGSCTLENVWIGDVGEDAISFKGSDSSQVMTITGGGAFEASDKVIQHNGPGTIKITNFVVKNAGKLYRSCGNCSSQYARHVEMTNVFASGVSVLAGINANYGDTATINSLTRCGTVSTTCETFTGNNSGDEPPALNKYTTSGDGKYCIFTASNIH